MSTLDPIKPLGAWGKPLVTRKATLEEKKRALELAAKRKADEKTRAQNTAAESLANKVETAISERGGGYSGNYSGDEQYSVKGTYETAVILLAFAKWTAKYPGQILSLNIHMLGPAPKYTGGRNGQLQANFIRLINNTSTHRFNVHINAK